MADEHQGIEEELFAPLVLIMHTPPHCRPADEEQCMDEQSDMSDPCAVGRLAKNGDGAQIKAFGIDLGAAG